MKRDLTSILDALIFCRKIVEFTQDLEEEDFIKDSKTQSAVMYQISILGEAMRRVSPQFYQQYPEIPSKQIIGMRNKLVHDYDGINIPLVWSVVKNQIPELIDILQIIIPFSE